MFGTIVSLLGTAASGVGSYLANKKEEETLKTQNALANAYYNKELMQDPTKRSDNAAMLRQLDRKLAEANKVSQNKNKIIGGTHENDLASQQTTANAYADAVSQMQSLSSQRRDSLLASQRENNEKYNALERSRQAAKMQNWANLANNAAKLGASSAQAYGLGSSSAGAKSETTQDSNVKNDASITAPNIGGDSNETGKIAEIIKEKEGRG